MNFKNTLTTHYETKKALIFKINPDIVDVVINDMLFNADDEESTSIYERILSIFKLFKDANNNQVELNREQALNHKIYTVKMSSLW